MGRIHRNRAGKVNRQQQRQADTELVQWLRESGHSKARIARICDRSITWVTAKLAAVKGVNTKSGYNSPLPTPESMAAEKALMDIFEEEN